MAAGGGGACMVAGGHAWLGGCAWLLGGVCGFPGGMHGKGAMRGEGGHVWHACPSPLYEIRPVNAWAVRILLKCILVAY